jgi:hypothetical protein
MDVITFLQNQLANIHANFHSIADDITEQEWVARPAPGQNLIASPSGTCSHTDPTQTWVRSLQIANGERWLQWRQLAVWLRRGYFVG